MGMASSRYNLGCALVSGAGKASPQQNVKAQGAGVNHPRYKLGPLSTVASKFLKGEIAIIRTKNVTLTIMSNMVVYLVFCQKMQ